MATKQSTTRAFKTDADIRNIQPQDKRIEYADLGCPGLRLRVEPSGRKSFIWFYIEGGRARVKTFGRYGKGEGRITLKEARAALEKAKLRHQEGEPVQGTDAPTTVSELAELFYTRRIVPHRKVPEAVRSVLDRDILPVIGRKHVQTISTPTLAHVVEKVVDRGAVVHAGKVLAILKQMFRFAAARGFIDQSPAYPLDKKDLGCQDNVSERWLTGEEIKQLWTVLDTHPRLSELSRIGLKILLLTGVRTNELLSATWSEIDFGKHVWNIPAEHSKTTGWTVPLVPEVEKLFTRLHRLSTLEQVYFDEYNDHVLASHESKSGRLSDKALARSLRRLFQRTRTAPPYLTFEPCHPHDFRRTLRTHLDDLKMVDPETGEKRSIEPHIAEKCLNHSLGRIERTYNKNTLLNHRRAALQAWSDYIDRLVTERDNVVEIAS